MAARCWSLSPTRAEMIKAVKLMHGRPSESEASPHFGLRLFLEPGSIRYLARIRTCVCSNFLSWLEVFSAFATGAEARTSHHQHSAHHHRHYAHHHHRHFSRQHDRHYARLHVHGHYAVRHRRQSVAGDSSSFSSSFVQQPTYERSAAPRHAHLGGRPRAWCGRYMRQQVGGDPGPQYNLARSWAHYGSNAGGPSIGARGLETSRR